MSREEFIESMANTSFIEEHNCFGHYPFNMISVMPDDKMIMAALALGGDVRSCYKAFKKMIDDGAKIVHMSVDFPKGLDIPTDYIGVYSFENGKSEVIALPYNVIDGKFGDRVTEGTMVDHLMTQFKHIVK